MSNLKNNKLYFNILSLLLLLSDKSFINLLILSFLLISSDINDCLIPINVLKGILLI